MDLVDSHGRILRDLRISVTDRCNFRCLYCLPGTEAAAQFFRGRWKAGGQGRPIPVSWKPRRELLSFEEIARVVRIAASCGIEKIRLTGGEPLLRQGLPRLVGMLSAIGGIRDLALTTNGLHFPLHARALADAGLSRASFSLDSVDPANFRRITGREGLEQALASVRLARRLGLEPVKVNAVVIRDINDHEIEDLCQWAIDEEVIIRFIEFMPLDSGRAWQREHVVPGVEILERLRRRFSLVPVEADSPAETAKRWRLGSGKAEVGIIAPVTQPFCGRCNRLRLTSDGQIRTCLFSLEEHDLRGLLRSGADDREIRDRMRSIVLSKERGHRVGAGDFVPPSRTMSAIGG